MQNKTKQKTGALSYSIYKINSKLIEELNVTSEIIKFLEENIGVITLILVLAVISLNFTPKPKATKTKINKWEHIKLKHFCTTKETINKKKRQHLEWEKDICQPHTW